MIWWGQRNTLILLDHVSQLHQKSHKGNFTIEAPLFFLTQSYTSYRILYKNTNKTKTKM
jgi:hypothetical protein